MLHNCPLWYVALFLAQFIFCQPNKSQELFMRVLLIVFVNNSSCGDFNCARREVVPFLLWSCFIVSLRYLMIGKPGCVLLGAWTDVFLSTQNMTEFAGGFKYKPTTSHNYPSIFLSLLTLNVIFQMRLFSNRFPCSIHKAVCRIQCLSYWHCGPVPVTLGFSSVVFNLWGFSSPQLAANNCWVTV